MLRGEKSEKHKTVRPDTVCSVLANNICLFLRQKLNLPHVTVVIQLDESPTVGLKAQKAEKEVMG